MGRGGATVGLDIGTTAVKAVLADDEGRVLGSARVPHAVGRPFPGAFEHDVDAVWRAGVLDALAAAVDAARVPVAGVCVAAMVPSLGAVRDDGRAAGPGLLYGDVRGTHERAEGRPGDSGELVAFLQWLAANCPDAAGFWPAQAVANHALCGRGAIDSTTAVTAHPLFDFTGWDAEVAASAGATSDALPDVVSGTDAVGMLADRLPAAGALVAGGTIDALAEQLVAGADDVGDVLVILGTTLITWAVRPGAAEVPGLWTIPHTAPGRWLAGGPSNAGGLFLDWIRANWGDADPAAAAVVDPGDVPVWLPYIRGERTPLHRTDLRASVHGLSLAHRPGHLRRAAYEASGFVVRHHLDLAAGAGEGGGRPARIVATGGGVRDGAWVQAIADVTGLPVDVVAVPEGAALGAAFVARCTAGLEEAMTDARRWARIARTVEPRPDWVEACSARYDRFRALQP
ncbi:MAG: xylulokinase [Acidimicrobiales bacterium]